jgi:hypothetical protein
VIKPFFLPELKNPKSNSGKKKVDKPLIYIGKTFSLPELPKGVFNSGN